ncbi:MAG: glycosyltransferase family 39 protein [Chloroflexi bacterium]|nr:glycosyltransferase family 39 protein [Chloroflexota bacterium]
MSASSGLSVRNGWNILFGLWTIHGLFAFVQFLASQKDLSVEEIVLAGALLYWVLLNIFLLFSLFRKSEWLFRRLDLFKNPTVKDRVFLFAAIAFFLLICLGIFRSIADRDIFRVVGYLNRLSPLLDLLAVVFAEVIALILFSTLREKIEDKEALTSFLAKLAIVLALLGVATIYISKTGMGIALIYKGDWARGLPAVPLLEWQILLACLFCVGMVVVESNQKILTIPRLDFWISLLIWIATAAIWLSQPTVPNSSALEPIAPNFEIHPFSDAQTYDEYAQSVLVGNGFGKNEIPQRPLYIVFLALSHVFAGQNYASVITLQTLVFAFFPVLLYLFGREFFGRPIGISIALLAILRDYTSNLVSPFTGNISYSKLYLAEIPTAMFLILFLWVGMRWIKSEFPAFSSFILGGILGVAMLIRTQVVVAFPMLLLFAFFSQPKKLIPIIKGALLTTVTMLLVISPWLWRNWRMTGQLIFDNPESQIANLALRYNRLNGVDVDITAQPDESNAEYNARLSDLASQALKQNPAGIAKGIANSFLNHGVSNILLLPLRNSLTDFGELWTPIEPFWQKWEGTPTASQSMLLTFYVLLFGLGLSLAWHRNGWLGLLPLAVNLLYNLWTSIALLSGQRFLLTMDWSIYLYYMIGLFALLGVFLFSLERGRSVITRWLGVNTSQPTLQPLTGKWQSYLVAGVLFFAIGASLPLSEMAFPERYPPVKQAEALDKIMASNVWKNSDIDPACFEKDRLIVSQGRALYPRYYEAKGGESFTDSVGYKVSDEGRLVFQILGQSNGRIIFPMSMPPEFFPNASDVTLFFAPDGNLWFILVEKDGEQRMYFSETQIIPACK